MSERKARREIDKAIRHLMDYTGPNDEWATRLDSLMDQFLTLWPTPRNSTRMR